MAVKSTARSVVRRKSVFVKTNDFNPVRFRLGRTMLECAPDEVYPWSAERSVVKTALKAYSQGKSLKVSVQLFYRYGRIRVCWIPFEAGATPIAHRFHIGCMMFDQANIRKLRKWCGLKD